MRMLNVLPPDAVTRVRVRVRVRVS